MGRGRLFLCDAARRGALVAGLLAASCAPPDGGAASRTGAIVGGTVDSTTEAVMALYRTADSRMCSGTTIARVGGSRIFLTAAHCVVRIDADGAIAKPVTALAPSQMIVIPGVDWSAGYRFGQVLTVTDVAYVPAYDGVTTNPNDLALVRYTVVPAVAAIPAIPFLEPGEDKLAVGDAITLVGYGRTGGDAGTNLERRRVDKKIETLTPYAIQISQTDGKGGCQGDSGGPALRTTPAGVRVAGVTSYGDTLCATFNSSVRVSAHAAFIQAFIAKSTPDAGVPPVDATPPKDTAPTVDANAPDRTPPPVDAAPPPVTCGKAVDPRPACAACVANRCCFEARLCDSDPLCRGCGANPLPSCYLYPPAAAFADCLAMCPGNPCGIVSRPNPGVVDAGSPPDVAVPFDAGVEVSNEPPIVTLPIPVELPDAAADLAPTRDAAVGPPPVLDAATVETTRPDAVVSDAADGASSPRDARGDANALAGRTGCGCDISDGAATGRVALALLTFASIVARRRRVTMPRNERS
jgi:MYXO-CTERM domain-containing protein